MRLGPRDRRAIHSFVIWQSYLIFVRLNAWSLYSYQLKVANWLRVQMRPTSKLPSSLQGLSSSRTGPPVPLTAPDHQGEILWYRLVPFPLPSSRPPSPISNTTENLNWLPQHTHPHSLPKYSVHPSIIYLNSQSYTILTRTTDQASRLAPKAHSSTTLVNKEAATATSTFESATVTGALSPVTRRSLCQVVH